MFHTDVCRKRVTEENETDHAEDRTRRTKQGEMHFTERTVGETDQKQKEVLQGVADKESGKRLRVAEDERLLSVEDERLFPLLTGRSSYSDSDGSGRIPERERREKNNGRQKIRQTTAVIRIFRKRLRSVGASRRKKTRIAFECLSVEKLRGSSGRWGRRDYGWTGWKRNIETTGCW